jgi:release factor glutamine methyltransferase
VSTAAALLGEGAAALAAAAIENPRFEAGLLLGAATDRSRGRLASHPDEPVAASDAEQYRAFIVRRAAREPMAYVLGRAEFWSLGFAVGPGVLVPRPDSETLIEAATRAYPDRARSLRVLDLGVGSGCLLLTLLHHFPNARGIGTDTSQRALAYARLNAERLGVDPRAELVEALWAQGVDGPFDIVVSNPPYVPTGEIDGLQPEVSRFEPRAALDGGPDGLDAYRAILPELRRLLSSEGSAFLEIGRGQEVQVVLMAAGKVTSVRWHRDLAGVTRCLELYWV